MYNLTPEASAKLTAMVEQTVRLTLQNLLEVAALDPRTLFEEPVVADVSDEQGWRQAVLRRYNPSSWKHMVVSMAPWKVFAPAEIYKTHGPEIARRFPNHVGLAGGTSVTINELVRDGVLAKVGPARYSPAANGEALFH